MSKFTQQEETAIIKNAMELTATIIIEENELKKIKAEKFRQLPTAPSRKILSMPKKEEPKYPPKPITQYSFKDYINEVCEGIKKYFMPIGIILAAIFILGIISDGASFIITALGLITSLGFLIVPVIIYLYYSFSVKRKKINQDLAESPEYLNAVENAKKTAQEEYEKAQVKVKQEQEKIDADYKKQKEHYEMITVPEYNQALDNWSTVKERKINFLEEEIKLNTEYLTDLYDTSKLVSKTYRDIALLRWLYEDMSSSDHDIRYATELLDRDRQRIVTIESSRLIQSSINTMNQNMMSGFNAVYNAIEYGNELQEDTIDVLSKARRDMNVGNIVGTVQRHNTNKMLKSMLK